MITILQHKAIFKVFSTTLPKGHIIAIVMMDTSVKRPINITVLILTNVLLDFTIAVWIRNVSIAQVIFNVRVKSASKWSETDAQDRDQFIVLQCYLCSMRRYHWYPNKDINECLIGDHSQGSTDRKNDPEIFKTRGPDRTWTKEKFLMVDQRGPRTWWSVDPWSQLFKPRLLQWYWWQLWMCLPGWFRRWWRSVH